MAVFGQIDIREGATKWNGSYQIRMLAERHSPLVFGCSFHAEKLISITAYTFNGLNLINLYILAVVVYPISIGLWLNCKLNNI